MQQGRPGHRPQAVVLVQWGGQRAGRAGPGPGVPPRSPSAQGGDWPRDSRFLAQQGLLCLLRVAVMEQSGSLFPSLVVVGHVVTLAAVWHWRRGRRGPQDEQGKQHLRRQPLSLPAGRRPCQDAGGGTGRRVRLPPPLLFPCPPLPVSELTATACLGKLLGPPPRLPCWLKTLPTSGEGGLCWAHGWKESLGGLWIEDRVVQGHLSPEERRLLSHRRRGGRGRWVPSTPPVQDSGCAGPRGSLEASSPSVGSNCAEVRQVPACPRPGPRAQDEAGSQAGLCPPLLKVTGSWVTVRGGSRAQRRTGWGCGHWASCRRDCPGGHQGHAQAYPQTYPMWGTGQGCPLVGLPGLKARGCRSGLLGAVWGLPGARDSAADTGLQ